MLLIIAIVGTTVAPVAAVLPAVEHRRQADHPALDQLRAARHVDRRGRGRGRRRRADVRVGVRVRAAPPTSGTSPTPARPPPGSSTTLGPRGRRVLRDRAAERLADRGGRADAVDQLCVRRHLRRPRARCTAASPTPRASTRCSRVRDRRRRGDRADPRRAARA